MHLDACVGFTLALELVVEALRTHLDTVAAQEAEVWIAGPLEKAEAGICIIMPHAHSLSHTERDMCVGWESALICIDTSHTPDGEDCT